MIVVKNVLDSLNSLKKTRLKSCEQYIKYIKLLADTGFLDQLYFSFKIEDQTYIQKNWQRLVEFQGFNGINNLVDYLDQNNIVAQSSLEKNDQYSFEKTLLKIDTQDDYLHEDIVLLNYYLNKALKNLSLNSDIILKVFNIILNTKKCNGLRRDFCLLQLSEYAVDCNLSEFYQLKKKFYNHVQRVLEQIYKSTLLSDIDKQVLYQKVSEYIYAVNPLKTSKKPKYAVCISGLYRNHPQALESILEKIVKPLNADVFVHSWDEMHLWAGIGGNTLGARVFGRNNLKYVPKILHTDVHQLKNYSPKIYELLKSPQAQPFDRSEFERILCPKKIRVDNQDQFIKQLKQPNNFALSRGNFNQIKMFYGLMSVFNEALEYADYDYIIRVRPDILIEDIDTNIINNLRNNKIYTTVSGVGLNDSIFILSSSMAHNLCQYIQHLLNSGSLSPYPEFPLYDAHNTFTSWMIENRYSFGKDAFTYSLLTTSDNQIKLKNIKQIVHEDMYQNSQEQNSVLNDFYSFIIKKFSGEN